MFTTISWATYGTAVAAVLVLYYLIVGFKYYFAGARAIFKKKAGIQTQPQDEVSQEPSEQIALQELAERLVAVIRTASENNYSTQELKQSLHALLKEYSSVKDSLDRVSINKLIVAQCNNNASITLHEEEVELLWNGIA